MICPTCSQESFRRSGKIKVEKMTKDGLKTISYQTYRCENGHSFSDKTSTSKFTNSFIEYAVAVYLRSLSLNTTVDILSIDFEKEVLTKKTLLSLVEKVADRLPTLNDIDNLFHPQRSGYLAFDGVYFKLAGESFVVLICFDPETFDPIDYALDREETYDGYRRLCLTVLEKLDHTQTKVMGIYCDGEKSLIKALKEVYPDVPKQLCVVHKYLRMGQVVPFKSVNRKGVFYLKRRKILKFKKLFEGVIFAEDKKTSLAKFRELDAFTRKHFLQSFYKGYRLLKRNFKLTLTHFDYPHMNRDNNLIECFNSIISRKFDLFKGFKKDGNVERYLKLVFLDYRFHKLTESRFAYRRDQSPLELSRASLPSYYNFIKMLRETLHLDFEN